ncbi:MAG: hypothetical protein M1536_04160 [Firmicutes bacterium]|nr:hypothetical protein [Bacillota bacterium]
MSMKRNCTKFFALFLIAVYVFMTGVLISHHHDGFSPGPAAAVSLMHQLNDCPSCQWGAKNISTLPSLPEFLFSFLIHRCETQKFPHIPSIKRTESITPRAPPAA